MSKTVGIITVLVIAAVVVIAVLMWPQAAASRKSFGQCLTENGVVMYGADSCSYCQTQKNFFGKDFSNVEYVNCQFQDELCRERGITVYPVWSKGNDVLVGLQSFESLSQFSGCPLPKI